MSVNHDFTSAPAEGATAVTGKKPSSFFNFMGLPPEVQSEIVAHCSQSDLICLMLVSRHFRELAAAQLYRNFHIVFPDEDDPAYDSPIDSLAAGLNTFVTSDYNYAKHLKFIHLDTLSAGSKAEKAYKPYLFANSCGKFMNTLLLLTLQRASSLENFRWNIRVELSRPVYEALHNIDSVKNFHIRMQAGSSLWEPLPPLNPPPNPAPVPADPWGDGTPSSSLAPSQPPTAPYTAALPHPVHYHHHHHVKPLLKAKVKPHSGTEEPPTLAGFKNLKSLAVLDIEDLDVVEELKTCIQMSSSTLKHLKLSFSDALASRARKPQPESESEESEAEDEFQVVAVTINPAPFDASGPARIFRAQEERKKQETMLSKVFGIESTARKQSEKKTKDKKKEEDRDKTKGKDKDKPAEDDKFKPVDSDARYLAAIQLVAGKLVDRCHGTGELSKSQQQEMLDVMVSASKLYLEERGPRKNEDKENAEKENAENDVGRNVEKPSAHAAALLSAAVPGQGPSSSAPGPAAAHPLPPLPAAKRTALHRANGNDALGIDLDTASSDVEIFDDDASDVDPTKNAKPSSSASGSTAVAKAGASSSRPMSPVPADTNVVAAKDGREGGDVETSTEEDTRVSILDRTQASDTAGEADSVKRDIKGKAPEKVDKGKAPEKIMSDSEAKAAEAKAEAEAEADSTGTTAEDESKRSENMDEGKISEVVADAGQATSSDVPDTIFGNTQTNAEHEQGVPGRSIAGSAEGSAGDIDQYVLATRGLSVESLSIHLIPVKASVLSRAFNLSLIRKLTLLNVGNQTPIWNLLAKENKVRSLGLCDIFTDHVTTQFLMCVSRLAKVEELLMLERSAKYKPESFAPKPTTSLEQIRRLALRRHMHTLKVLMVKDCSNSLGWDIDEKTMMLICNRGVNLRELAVSMGIHSVHFLSQHLSGLVNLRALHINKFRNSDTCPWVMRETLRFIVDSVAHNPHLKLEWIAVEDDRLDRIIRSKAPSQAGSGSVDGAEKKGKTKAKAKGKENLKGLWAPLAPPPAAGPGSALPMLPVDGWDYSDSESESEDLGESGSRLRVKTETGNQFYDIWGVRIFDKEIRNGRL